MSRKDIEKALGDAQYLALKRGINPDRVSEDRIAETIGDHFDPYDCAESEVRRLAAQDHKRKGAQCAYPECGGDCLECEP